MKEVFVLAGGPSLQNFDYDLLKNKDVIAVNKAILTYPQAKHFVTMDYSLLHKVPRHTLFENDAHKVFIANISHASIVQNDGRIVDSRFNLIYDLKEFDTIIKSKKTAGFGFDFNDFRSGINSGHCAVQLAILLGYTDIFLLGLDYKTDGTITHCHGGYGESVDKFNAKLILYRENFIRGIHDARGKVNLVSCSQSSALNFMIPYLPISKVL